MQGDEQIICFPTVGACTNPTVGYLSSVRIHPFISQNKKPPCQQMAVICRSFRVGWIFGTWGPGGIIESYVDGRFCYFQIDGPTCVSLLATLIMQKNNCIEPISSIAQLNLSALASSPSERRESRGTGCNGQGGESPHVQGSGHKGKGQEQRVNDVRNDLLEIRQEFQNREKRTLFEYQTQVHFSLHYPSGALLTSREIDPADSRTSERFR
jgi:hypothetical protein